MQTDNKSHNLVLEGRKNLRISAVSDIDSFTESKIVLSTSMGELVIKGENLHIISLEPDNGDFLMTGTINSLVYSRYNSIDGPIKKLFR